MMENSKDIKGYVYSLIAMLILVIIFEYLQKTYFTALTQYLFILIPLAIVNTLFTYLGYKNLKQNRFQKVVGFIEIIFLIVVLNSTVYLIQLPTLTAIGREMTIAIFGILTLTLIVAIMNIAYESKEKKKIIPLNYGEEA